MSWRDLANKRLSELFVVGKPAPSALEIRDAYPFGERAYHPYKVWLSAVREWKAAWAKGLSQPEARRPVARRKAERTNADQATGSLFDGASEAES